MPSPSAETEHTPGKESAQSPNAENRDCKDEALEGKAESDKRDPDDEGIKEEESSEGSDQEDESEVEPVESPDELVKVAKEMLKQEDFAGALNRFSWAIQKQERLLASDREYPPELASFFLDYGNALLVKEEHSNELVSFCKSSSPKKRMESDGNAGSGETPEPTSDERGNSTGMADEGADNVTDEQLAWENLEMARICFTNKLAEQKEQGTVNLEDVVDATFVNIRLGDMLTLQEKFADACKEYEAAIDLRQEFKLPYPRLQAPTLSLAQAQLFSGDPEKALQNFRRALELIESNLAGVEGHTVADDKKADFEATAEDLKIQITETEKAVAAMKEKGELPEGCPGNVAGRVRILPEHACATTSTFDKPQLQGEVFTVGADTAQEKHARNKKRRIDLSDVNAKMAATHSGASSS